MQLANKWNDSLFMFLAFLTIHFLFVNELKAVLLVIIPGAHAPVSTWGKDLSGAGGTMYLRIYLHDSHLGGIFLSIVDIISIVPVTSRDVSALDGDRARPSSAAASTIRNNAKRGILQFFSHAKFKEALLPIGTTASGSWRARCRHFDKITSTRGIEVPRNRCCLGTTRSQEAQNSIWYRSQNDTIKELRFRRYKILLPQRVS